MRTRILEEDGILNKSKPNIGTGLNNILQEYDRISDWRITNYVEEGSRMMNMRYAKY
jgi:hypothetical protein